jgi:hypothetical protein
MAVVTIDTPETRKPRRGNIVTVSPKLGVELMYENEVWRVWSLGHAPGCFWLIRTYGEDTHVLHVHKTHLSNPPQMRLI